MALSLGISTQQSHHRLFIEPNSSALRPRAPPVRGNASKRLRTIASLRSTGGSKEKETNFCRRALLMLGLAGSSLLRHREAEAVEMTAGSEDAYVAASFLRGRLQKERRREYSPPSVGGPAKGTLANEIQERDPGTNGVDSVANKGQRIEEIDQKVPPSPQDATDVADVDKGLPSPTQIIADVDKEIPSSMRNETASDQKGVPQENLSTNTSFSILNAVGILGTGVLGALYASSQKDKAAMQTAADSMKALLEEKEAARRLLQKNFENKILSEQEEHRKEIKALQDGEAAISIQLSSATATISALGQELQSEKKAVKELEIELNQLRAGVLQAKEEKSEHERKIKDLTAEIDALQDRADLLGFGVKERDLDIKELNSSLDRKRTECEKLSNLLTQTKDDYKSSCASLEKLKEEVDQTKEDLTLKNSKIAELKGKLISVATESDNTKKDIASLQEQYNNLKMASTKAAEMNSKLISEKDHQIHQLEQKIDLALKEIKDKQELAISLQKEKNDYEVTLKEETQTVKNLQEKIQKMQANQAASKTEYSKLSDLLKESRDECEDLKLEISKAEIKFSEQKNSLTSSLDESRAVSGKLSNELAMVKEDLNTATNELLMVTNKLKASLEACERSKDELSKANRKVEAANYDLQKEREVVANLNEELEVSRKQITELLETRNTLEIRLEKASQSLDEMNNKTRILSQELESAQSNNMQLEKEKEMLEHSVVRQRAASQEALENIEDAQNVIFRLGAERESLVRKNEKLEDEIASAKGEILLLRQKAIPRGTSLNENYNTTNGVEATTTPNTAKRTSGRRKRGGQVSG